MTARDKEGNAPIMPYHPQTLALHGGRYRTDPATGAVAVPIYQTTSYLFHDTGHAERLFSLQETGFTYTRTGNPTRDTAERRLAALDEGAGALIVASGAAARLYSLLNLAQTGDNLVAASTISGAEELTILLARQGIALRLADPDDAAAFAHASDERTRAYFGETVTPAGALLDIAALAAAGRTLGIPLIVDNSAAPVAVKPLELGAAVTVYDGASYLSGSSGVTAGAIVDGGRFSWSDHAARCPALTQPDSSYHGAVWTEVAAFFNTPLAYLTRARMRLLRDFGGVVSPFDVFTLIQGMETLPIRMRTHGGNGRILATYLRERSDIDSAIHAEFDPRSLGTGLVTFRPAGGAETARRVLSALKLIRPEPGFGSAYSQASLLSATTTGTILLSAGLEHPDDLATDLAQALDKAGAI